MIPCNKTYYQDIAFYNGSIYVTTDDGALSVADTTSSQITSLLPAPLASAIPAFLERHVPKHYCLRRCRIVVSGGDRLLMCCVPASYSSVRVPIAIYKADFEIGRWQMVDGLRPKQCFWGRWHAYRWIQEMSWGGVEGDCIFNVHQAIGVRRFRVSWQSCRTHNVVEQDSPDSWPSLFKRRRTCYMLTPKPNLSVLN